ncbi:xylose isomerase [Marinitoga sp. 38H-ov]|uniref:xylose isomerase n=1 Tax=Marinitoga sp. 38H-ov TaxID=1755814 RepID=UPI0013ED275F|nr:xylose isomerase [Marinitoga sp. 38H-ov]KAF2956773.1 xylose isomerase [Marinitoga sp. 38H-ov]
MFFKNIDKIKYEGEKSQNPLSYRYYDPEEEIKGKKMKDWFKFSVAYWHTLNNKGMDPFGSPTMNRPWDLSDPLDSAYAKVDAMFEFCEKLGLEYFTFHDVDIAPEGETIRESYKNLDKVVDKIKENMKSSKVKLLWGTANLFSHPRYAQGAATSPNPEVYAYAAAQVKKALEITNELNGLGYVLWGGREGYDNLLLTNSELEEKNFANFLKMVSDYKNKIGFNGVLLIEPKPKEPTKHQYDYDSLSVIAFLKKYGLDNDYKLNIEANHATLAGHTFSHELRYARLNNKLGSIDANRGDLLLGWDTDQFPTNVYETTFAMYEVLKNNGVDVGFNFDAKVRRASTDLLDLFYGHISGIDAFALGLRIANKLMPIIDEMVEKRYEKFNNDLGKEILNGETNLEKLSEYIMDKKVEKVESLKQELLELIINMHMF